MAGALTGARLGESDSLEALYVGVGPVSASQKLDVLGGRGRGPDLYVVENEADS